MVKRPKMCAAGELALLPALHPVLVALGHLAVAPERRADRPQHAQAPGPVDAIEFRLRRLVALGDEDVLQAGQVMALGIVAVRAHPLAPVRDHLRRAPEHVGRPADDDGQPAARREVDARGGGADGLVDRRVRLLERFRVDRDRVLGGNARVFALVDQCLARPGLHHHVEALDEARARLVDVDAEAGELALLVADADADVDAPAAELIDDRDLLGDAHGVVERQYDDRRADADAIRARGDVACHYHRVGEDAVPREVVLTEPEAVEAEAVRLYGEVHHPGEHLAVAFALVP